MLKAIRIILALASFVAVSLLFLDVTGYASAHWGWMAKIQLVPALLALNVGIVALLIVATLILGRAYCSLVCPLGIFQDIINRISGWFAPRRKRRAGRFTYQPAYRGARLAFAAVFVVLVVAGLLGFVAMSAASLIEPYSAFGRMVTWLGKPLWIAGENVLADTAAERGSYAFAHVAQMPLSVMMLTVAGVTLVVVGLMAWLHGRLYCNSVCPVGTALGYLSRFSLLKPVINTDKCNGCGSCARHCKTSCINSKAHAIDYTRCVDCMDCISECRQSAISYTLDPRYNRRPVAEATPDKGRRAFLIGGAILAGSAIAKAASKTTDGGFAPLNDKQPSSPSVPLAPAGAKGHRALAANCTACQLCISACPNGVLHPSDSLDSLMQPVMSFNNGYCRPECTACGDACPTGAIVALDRAEKSSVKIGTAVVDASACISASQGTSCGNCARHCPTEAITMVTVPDGLNLRPTVNENLCIGCGSCEYHCPVGTSDLTPTGPAAIRVEGIEVHRTI